MDLLFARIKKSSILVIRNLKQMVSFANKFNLTSKHYKFSFDCNPAPVPMRPCHLDSIKRAFVFETWTLFRILLCFAAQIVACRV